MRQICNAGFVVPHSRRGLGLGVLLAKSYLHFAPALGYRGSVFNLVYADNPASLRIWDSLGFQRVGIVPGAGKRIRKGSQEVYYVDAHVIFKSFVWIVLFLKKKKDHWTHGHIVYRCTRQLGETRGTQDIIWNLPLFNSRVMSVQKWSWPQKGFLKSSHDKPSAKTSFMPSAQAKKERSESILYQERLNQ